MSFFSELSENNEFPIIFIGSGITQRYFENAPTWDGLLEKLWNEAQMPKAYYARYDELKKSKKKKSYFEIYTELAQELEEHFDSSFYNGKLSINSLTPKEAHQEDKSPLRYRIAEIYSSLKLREGVEEEVRLFRKMLKKARLIVTTNYDDFIEKQFDFRITTRIGNRGLFEKSTGISELYKIHGSVSEPNSIVITANDYVKLERTSAIVNAKILSQLVDSPIVFLGYSLTDENVRSLLKDLTDNMPFSVEDAAARIGVVDYQPGKTEVEEIISNTDFGVHYTQISTDNFAEVYKRIAKVDQGISPLEIAKYQGAFRQIIEEKGRRKELKQVLTSFVDLDKLPEELQNKNLVVAFGDNRFIYKYPSYVDYIKIYFGDVDDMPLGIAIKFILAQSTKSTLPVSKYLLEVEKGDITLTEKEKIKINKRLSRFNSIDSLNVKLPAVKYLERIKNMDFSRPEVLFSKNDIRKTDVLSYFINNIDNYSKDTAISLIKFILRNETDGFIKDTICRKLFMAYSLKYETIVQEI